MIAVVLALFRQGWRIESLDALSACWVLVREGERRSVSVPDEWVISELAL